MGLSPLVVLLLVGAAVNLGLAVVGWRRREVTAATPFVVVTLGIAFWTGTDALQYTMTDLGTVSLFARVSYLGNLVVPFAAFAFIVIFTGRRHWLTRTVVGAMAGWTVLTYLLALTTPAHGLLWSDRVIRTTEPVTVTSSTFGPWFWLNLLVVYGLLLVALLLLAGMIADTYGRRRRQAVLVLAATLMPVVGNIPWLFDASPIPGLDLTPFGFAATGMFLGVALFAFGFLDLSPVARHAIVEELRDPVLAIDTQGRVADLNPAAVDLLGEGARPDEVIGRPLAEVLPATTVLLPDRAADGSATTDGGATADAGAAADAGETLADDASETRTDVAVETDGEVREFDARATPLRDEGGTIVGRLVMLRDVTERRENERRLAERERRNRQLVDALPDGLIGLFDEDLTYLRVGGGGMDRLPFTSADFEGARIPEFHTDGFVDRFVDHYRGVFEGEEAEFAFAASDRFWHTTLVPLRDESGEVTVGLAFTMDVTELRERERQLERQNERLEEFVGVVSHDLRNPLNVLHGRLQLAREDEDSREHVERAQVAAERMDQLISDLLDLARTGSDVEATERVVLASVASEAWASIEAPDASMRVEGSPTVHADRSRLRQALENCFRNAVEHGSTSPRSHAREDAVAHGGDDGAITVREIPGGFAVDDDGPGFPPEADVFQWGVTTDETGTGFGLSIVAEVAAAHGWDVTAGESPEGGARVAFTGVDVDQAGTS